MIRNWLCIFMDINCWIKSFAFAYSNIKLRILPYWHVFTFLNCISKALFVLIFKSKCRKPNLKESECRITASVFFENSSFLAYSGQREDNLEIRDFWGLTNHSKPLIYGHLGLKKALTKSAILGNSGVKKGRN